MKELIKGNFDKLLLFGLIIWFTGQGVLLLIKFPNIDAATLQWAEKSTDLTLGALIGAITTQAVKGISGNVKEKEGSKDSSKGDP
jgi:hypothetical protein